MIKTVKKNLFFNDSMPLVIPLECAEIIRNHAGLVVFIGSSVKETLKFAKLIKKCTDTIITLLPDSETLPYDHIIPNEKAISSQLSILYHLSNMKQGILIIAIQTLLKQVISKKNIIKKSFLIKKNDVLELQNLSLKLQSIGYQIVNKVKKFGEFSIKNSLMDIYSIGEELPCRIYFLNNIVINLKLFSLNNQLTFKEKDYILIFPKYRHIINEEKIKFSGKIEYPYFYKKIYNNYLYENIFNKEKKHNPRHLKSFFLKHNLSTLFDYLSETTLIIYPDQYKNHANIFWKKIIERYNLSQKNNMHTIIDPEKIWMKTEKLSLLLKQYSSYIITYDKNFFHKRYKLLPKIFFQYKSNDNIDKIFSFLYNFSGKIIFYLSNKEHLENFLITLKKRNIIPKYIKNFVEINQIFNYFYIIENLNSEFIDTKNNFLLVSADTIFPIFNTVSISEKIVYKKNNLHKLKLNDPIVHIEHGIGRYQGLTTINTASIESEYLIILYAEGNKLYVPIAHLHLISLYRENISNNLILHKLGSDKWSKEKKKITAKLCDHAAILLNIYSNRLSQRGFSFKKNQQEYQNFCKDFPFQITLDQEKVICSVLNDMQRSVPMDRLICGDVGFGKTEVAMRAAFICISNKKQVVILVPTTLLAQQHFDSFKTRFYKLSINISILSRFENKQEQKKILENTKNGKINILIGTHKILLTNIIWHNLGLLIIDEEHRFGVYHKEIIKNTYSNIDILTLTATPIPRTLNMAMTGIKDLSIISEPPKERLQIKTFIEEYNPYLIKEAILREISRGGQVYYIYNKVHNINNIALKLSHLIPDITIKVGHGKMKNIQLKEVINEFYHHKFDVLVCTTIIESGIDIPKANTIIIENADHFGLSQLHQLRGRIGRSNYQAYAFLLVNSFKSITSDARKRLQALSSMNSFRDGFSLSNEDLEIRGIGELLGKEQSGHIHTIGFSLYIKLLKKSIQCLQSGKKIFLLDELVKKSDIDLYVPAFLPENYIFDVNTRLLFYKKIANARKTKDIEKIQFELIDQFGPIPPFGKNLILISQMRLITEKIGITQIKSNEKVGIIEFNRFHCINTKYLLNVFRTEPNLWKMENEKKLKFYHSFKNSDLRLQWIKNLLNNLQKNTI